MSLVDDVDNMDYDVNPIAAYCECEDAVNNFATTTLAEKEMYKANIQYLFARALNYLVTLEDLESLEQKTGGIQSENCYRRCVRKPKAG